MSKTDIGIDLGTANTVITLGKKGVVLCEPSAIAYHKRTKEVLGKGIRTNAVGLVLGNNLDASNRAIGGDANHELNVTVIARGRNVKHVIARVGLIRRVKAIDGRSRQLLKRGCLGEQQRTLAATLSLVQARIGIGEGRGCLGAIVVDTRRHATAHARSDEHGNKGVQRAVAMPYNPRKLLGGSSSLVRRGHS